MLAYVHTLSDSGTPEQFADHQGITFNLLFQGRQRGTWERGQKLLGSHYLSP